MAAFAGVATVNAAACHPKAPQPATLRQLLAWALYDWANSPFFAVIITFVFAAYVTEGVAADTVAGTAAWGWAMTVSGLLVAITSPVLGAIADAGGPRKPWLLGFTTLCAAATAGLWFIRPEPSFLALALLLVVIANVAAEIAQSFYNAMLPDLAPASHLGRWSGWGWAIGYMAGIAALLLLLQLFIQGDPPALGLDPDEAEHVRVSGPVVALWLLVFALPLFVLTPDRPRMALQPGRAIVTGLRRLWATALDLRRDRNLLRFLIARLVYNDGLNTLFAFGGIYAAGSFGMETAEIILFGIALNLTAGIGAFLLAWLDDRLGSKPTILIAVGGLFVFGLVALVTTDKTIFWAVALLLGLFIGPTQSASRSLMARLSPPERMAEMFGIYALTGKVTAFIGPFLFASATLLFATQRAGMAVILVMLAAGGLLLLKVEEPSRAG
jgi:MFS transporter, UMF1 family